MNLDNFIVKLKRETVGRFQERGQGLGETFLGGLCRIGARGGGLALGVEMDGVEARLFDLKILRLQVCLVEGNGAGF
jgi:hypothetical protein